MIIFMRFLVKPDLPDTGKTVFEKRRINKYVLNSLLSLTIRLSQMSEEKTTRFIGAFKLTFYIICNPKEESI
jgi:hypothetical protein